jgi:hypothetical protein
MEHARRTIDLATAALVLGLIVLAVAGGHRVARLASEPAECLASGAAASLAAAPRLVHLIWRGP